MRLPLRRKLPPYITLPMAAAAAGALGYGLGTTGLGGLPTYASQPKTPPPPSTGPVPSDLAKYAFTNSDCGAVNEADPVSVLFVKDGFPDWITRHMGHDGWDTPAFEGDPDYFNAYPVGEGGAVEYECGEQEGQMELTEECPLYTPGVCTRFHIRYYMHKWHDAPRVHPSYGGFASSTPHHEDAVVNLGCGTLGYGHAVNDNFEEFEINKVTVGGGFNYAREEIKRSWVRNQHVVFQEPWPPPPTPIPYTQHQHPLVDIRNWDNTVERRQCNGWRASSSGIVYYIGVKA